MDDTPRDEQSRDRLLRRAVLAAADGDSDALIYLWVRFGDEVCAALVSDGVDQDVAQSLTARTFAPNVIASCRDTADLVECLAGRAREQFQARRI